MFTKIITKSCWSGLFLIFALCSQTMQACADPQEGMHKTDRDGADQAVHKKPLERTAHAVHSAQSARVIPPTQSAEHHAAVKPRLTVPVRAPAREPFAYKADIRHDFDQKFHPQHNFMFNMSFDPVVIDIPSGLMAVYVNGQKYYYNESIGVFYQESLNGFFPVNAPIGALVAGIPANYATNDINGINYYIYNGVYYTWSIDGYRVVASNVLLDQQADQNAFTINVPRKSGGYVAILSDSAIILRASKTVHPTTQEQIH